MDLTQWQRAASADPQLLNTLPMQYVLKILSGALNGVEYTLSAGDTIFHVGSQQDLVDGKAARALAHTDNAYFIPDDRSPAAFLVQILETDGVIQLRLGERSAEQQAWQFQPLPTQYCLQAAGVHFAVRAAGEPWAARIISFEPPHALATVAPGADGQHPPPSPRGRRPRPFVFVSAIALLVIAVSAVWFYWQYLPEARVRGLAGVLRDAPSDYQILAADNGRLYAFADDSAARTWGERASRRLGRKDDIYLVRHEEARRVEQLMITAGETPVVVRLGDPARPEIVMSGVVDAARRTHIEKLLASQVPYPHAVNVIAITDAELVRLAQRQLRILGISTRAEPVGQRVSVVNDVFLDDASLSRMTVAAQAFHRVWGQRRITIQLQLWDDLLQGRSYQYSPNQLMSVGGGHWGYARPAAAVNAAP